MTKFTHKIRKHESSRKLREEEIIGDNLFLSQFPERLPGGKRKPIRKKEAEEKAQQVQE